MTSLGCRTLNRGSCWPTSDPPGLPLSLYGFLWNNLKGHSRHEYPPQVMSLDILNPGAKWPSQLVPMHVLPPLALPLLLPPPRGVEVSLDLPRLI